MKRISIILCLFFIIFSNAFAYNPTNNELEILGAFKKKITVSSKVKGELWLKKNIKSLENKNKIIKNERINYILSYLISDLNSILEELIIENEKKLKLQSELIEQKRLKELEEENIYNLNSSDFFNKYGVNITTDLEISEKCTKYFDFIDEIAKENNFPTELIIATWSKEYNCNLSNPANGWGPFQITSKYYTPGDITLEEFTSIVQTYIDFTKGKWDYFNNNKYHNYKSRFGEENINITYDNYSIRDLKLSAILYNGVSSSTTLNGNTFANSNLDSSVQSNSDGLVTRFLKVLNWRTKNK